MPWWSVISQCITKCRECPKFPLTWPVSTFIKSPTEREEKKKGSSRLRNRNENRRDKRRMQERDKKIRRVCVRACARVCERESSFIPRRFFNSEKRALSVRYGFESCVKESLFANDRQWQKTRKQVQNASKLFFASLLRQIEMPSLTITSVRSFAIVNKQGKSAIGFLSSDTHECKSVE